MEETKELLTEKMEETKDRLTEKLQETKGKVSLKKKVEQGASYTRFQTALALEPLETMDKGTCSFFFFCQQPKYSSSLELKN